MVKTAHFWITIRGILDPYEGMLKMRKRSSGGSALVYFSSPAGDAGLPKREGDEVVRYRPGSARGEAELDYRGG
jgi:hypothetical protein